MKKEENLNILKNKVDQDDEEAGPLKWNELKIIREQLTQEEMDGIKKLLEDDPKSYIPKYCEQMPKEDMLEQAKIDLKTLPYRISLKYDLDILKNYKFTS